MSRKKKPTPAVTIDSRLRLVIDGHELVGTKTADGTWTYACPDWPDLAGPVKPGDDYARVVGEFTTRCLAGAATVEQAVAALTKKGRRR